MPKSDQGVLRDRYMVIPRTLIFIRRGDNVLLLKGSSTKRLWPNRYNGVGGHIERGEDALSAARRELREETGLVLDDLSLSATILVDTGEDVGIGIYVYEGESQIGTLIESHEGSLEWIPISKLSDYDLVEDLPTLLPMILHRGPKDPVLSLRYYYDENEVLRIASG